MGEPPMSQSAGGSERVTAVRNAVDTKFSRIFLLQQGPRRVRRRSAIVRIGPAIWNTRPAN